MNYANAQAHVAGPYRYWLMRSWGDTLTPLGSTLRRLLWVMLNPSKADANRDDPTLKACVEFSRRGGFDALEVVNPCAYISSDPKDLLAPRDPFGPDNDRWIRMAANVCDSIVVAWGNGGAAFPERIVEVVEMLRPHGPLLCLGTTKSGQPRHPLRLHHDTPLREWFT